MVVDFGDAEFKNDDRVVKSTSEFRFIFGAPRSVLGLASALFRDPVFPVATVCLRATRFVHGLDAA
jgi:hypothetical protein